MKKNVNVIVLRTAGTNCNEETAFAFQESGAKVDQVHVNELLRGKKDLKDYHILAVPGGFSYGDDIASGKILANELRLRLGDELKRFIDDGKLIIGICNGFQILAKAGVLPGSRKDDGFEQESTLFTNDSGKFEDRWVHLKPDAKSVWTQGIKEPIFLPVAHGEGKFIARDEKVLQRLKKGQVVFRYASANGGKPKYPENPNGSVDDIAGISDETGRVFGLMPHPERHFRFVQHPYWTRLEKKSKYGDGAKIFQNGVQYMKENL